MPLYEYRCEKCGKVFEIIQKFSDAPLETHEACGGYVERLLSAPALQFKGAGWYVNDYAKGSSSKPADSKDSKDSKDGKPASTETKTESTKSETPATKTE